jgi:hypothetical protein
VTIYLESTCLESNPKVIGLTSKDGFVQVEMVRSADQFAVRRLLGVMEPGIKVSSQDEECIGLWLTQQSPS